MSKKVDKYTLSELINERNYYKTYKGFNRENSDEVYIRVYQNNNNLMQSPEYQEMNIMDHFKNDRFVSSINYLQTQNNMYFVYDYLTNLKEWMTKNQVKEIQILKIFQECC